LSQGGTSSLAESGLEMKLLISVFVSPVALLLVSLGLVVLKSRSNLPAWMARLTAPSFYLVSVPIATLIVGAEMLALYSLLVISELLSPYGFSWKYNSNYFFLNPVPAFYFYERPAVIASFIAFWAAVLISGYLLGQRVLRDDHQSSSRTAGRILQGSLLLVCFAWALSYLVSYIAWLITPPGV
jgi:hypothetical protein